MKVGVIGSGSMGSGIAQIAATHHCEVVVYDLHSKALDKAKAKLEKIMTRLVEKQKISLNEKQAIIDRHVFTNNFDDLGGCALVIEAVIEDLKIKQTLFKQLEDLLDQTAILATNTSSLSIASIASVCTHMERVIGLHFFNPAPLMPLVEVIPCVATDHKVVEQAKQIMIDWGKTVVQAKDTPGFIVNKVARPFYSEALRIYDEGLASIQEIDMAMKSVGQFRMGPFELMDFIGNDVNYKVTETVFKAFYNDPRYKPSFTQKRLSEAGFLGRKTGRGYYDYSADNHPPKTINAPQAQKIFMRIIAMLINEAYDTLFWRIATKKDIECAMQKGVNYPKGLFAWAKEIGIKNIVKTLEELQDHYQEQRYRLCPLLKQDAQSE